MKETLYGKDTKGGIKVWTISTSGDTIIVEHGKLNGKIQIKKTVCKGKNIGKKNETSPTEQAEAEAQSKYNKQLDKLYRPTIEELESVGGELPMLAHDFTKVGHRLTFPLSVSPKLDGIRALTSVKAAGVSMTSRGGKQYDVPPIIKKQLTELLRRVQERTIASVEEELKLDGELYIHGLPLQFINSIVQNPTVDKSGLRYYIFDVPHSERPWLGRYADLRDLSDLASDLTHLVFVPAYRVDSLAASERMLGQFIEEGYEGLMFRTDDGVYEYNHRSSGLMKWKLFKDTEALIENVTEDKNGEGVLSCVLKNGVGFDCKMKGTHDFRKYENMKTHIGEFITVKYQALTADGVPQFPVGLAFRKLDEEWNPLE